MKRNSKIILAAVTAVSLATGTVVFAAGGHGKMGNRMISKLTDRLELNEQQASALESLKLEIQETRDLMRADGESQGQSLMQLVSGDTFDQGAALEMITARTTAMQEQGPELVAAAAQFFDGLDSEQKQELNQMMDRFSERRGHRSQKDN